jgi:hypothetical protein
MRSVTLNHIILDHEKGYVRKKRTRIGLGLIRTGNIYAALTRERVRVLTTQKWIDREIWIFEHLYDQKLIRQPDGSLDMPWLGKSVQTWLTDPATPVTVKHDILKSAASTLARLHHTRYQGRFLSHADTSMQNVIYCPEGNRAYWIDFEMVHPSQYSDHFRHADDLRGLFYTALSLLPVTEREAGFQNMFSAYNPTENLTAELKGQLQRHGHCHDVYHRAQVRMNDPDHGQLTSFLISQLNKHVF